MKTILSILLSFCLVISASAWNPMVVTSGSSACATGSMIIDVAGATNNQALASDAIGQSISYGSEWDLYSIVVSFHSTSSSCVAEVRIGTAKDLSSYIEAWTNIQPNDAGEDVELVSVDNDTFSASTTYYVGVVETSGTCVGVRNNTNPYAGGVMVTSGTGWSLGADDSANDLKIEVYECN